VLILSDFSIRVLKFIVKLLFLYIFSELAQSVLSFSFSLLKFDIFICAYQYVCLHFVGIVLSFCKAWNLSLRGQRKQC
jgi:hypothetical protein